MLNISHYKIIAIGKIKKKWIQEGIKMYLKRLPGLEVKEIKDNTQSKEEHTIREIISKNEILVTLNENGQSFTSKELGRKLPKEISQPQSDKLKKQRETNKQKLHQVEIETNPEQLFRELMEISQDGNVPPHLLERLRKIESKNLKISAYADPYNNQSDNDLSSEDSLKLYTQFQQFLLEDDID